MHQPSQKKAAVFLDRDGTIIEEVNYLRDPAQIQLIPTAIPALTLLQQHFPLVIITNQSGIARGYLSENQLHQIHDHLELLLGAADVHLTKIYYCPHHPKAGHLPYRQACACRKPQPGMLLAAADELDLDLARSFTIGDQLSDIAAGSNAGTHTILVRTGYGSKHQQRVAVEMSPDYVADDLWTAATWILGSPEYWPQIPI
ncbi:MAG: HAD family hydrolase [Firmicutes bacterium]|nr:HAD family hydrolase [Bacillota bacterium]